jgi:NAD(P)-dependent dehydrogenase (short-subunit alcohol dehydrogenase family)
MTNFDTSRPLEAFDFSGETALVTGGARGIGRAVSETLINLGAEVVVADLDDAAVRRTAEELDATPAVLDVSNEDSVEQVLEAIGDRHPTVTMLVNNAGIAIRKPSVELSLADWQKVLDVNMTGVFMVARSVVRRYLSSVQGDAIAGQAKRAPRIVNMASIMGLSGGGLYANPSYQATKGAVVNMTRAMAIEWAEHGIRVNALAPTWVRTSFIDALVHDATVLEKIESMTPLGRLAEPEEVAAGAMFLLSPAASMITGHTLAIDGGYLAQ